MTLNVLLLKGNELLAAPVMTTEGEGDGKVQSTSREQRKERSVLYVSLELELREACEVSTPSEAALNKYKVREKDSKKKRDEEELNGIPLLRELKEPK